MKYHQTHTFSAFFGLALALTSIPAAHADSVDDYVNSNNSTFTNAAGRIQSGVHYDSPSNQTIVGSTYHNDLAPAPVEEVQTLSTCAQD
jgi:hypothetical protein